MMQSNKSHFLTKNQKPTFSQTPYPLHTSISTKGEARESEYVTKHELVRRLHISRDGAKLLKRPGDISRFVSSVRYLILSPDEGDKSARHQGASQSRIAFDHPVTFSYVLSGEQFY